MKKIIAVSLLLSMGSYLASSYLRQRSTELANAAAGVPHPELVVIPEAPDPNVKQQEVVDFEDVPNSEFRPSKSRPGTLEPVDPSRRDQMEMSRVYLSVSLMLRQGVWFFPALGVALIVWRKLEAARVRRLIEAMAVEEAEQTKASKEQP